MKPITPKFPKLIHGADYNPDQWLRYPEILKKDIELLKEAHMNSVSVGIFSWAHLEPEEGVYDFDWLEEIINNLYDNGIYTVLATPSGAKPLWMSEKYEEIRRVNKFGQRDLSGNRHNHCYTSPFYREKVRQMNTKLAERFANHPGVIMWHLSNEYGGECYCPLCIAEFRKWLKEKYKTIDALNHAWWTDFWSHTYSSFEQINPPFAHGEQSVHGLVIDWKRFVTHQTVDFMKAEMAAVKAVNPDIPCTANLMGFYEELDYFKFKDIDVVSWDNYPLWHSGDNASVAQYSAMNHDLMRSIKHENWLLMENTPSVTNWTPVSKLKKDGMHLGSAMQALAHGSNSIQYFQFRKSRGSSEKFHGAVVDHVGHSNTRVFREVTKVGKALENLTELIYSTSVKPEVALVYDWENRWAVERAQGPRTGGTHFGGKSSSGINYMKTLCTHHKAFWKKGINVDIVDMDGDISGYKVVVAPMLYMYRAGFEEKMKDFVAKGGTLITTVNSGIVDETDLCFLGGWPGAGMMEVFGLWNESIDGLWDEDRNSFVMAEDAPLKGEYEVKELCALIHPSTAKVLASYGSDFYKGEPALTVNDYGKGKAYYIGAQPEEKFLDELYDVIISDCGVKKVLDIEFPYGVTAHSRIGENGPVIFIENYTDEEKTIELPGTYKDVLTALELNSIKLQPYEVRVLTD